MMLRFRKMMAVLLAAALTLTMLTACGGGGSGASVDAKVKLTNDINSILPEGYPKVKYDKELDNGAYTFQGAYIRDKKETNDILKKSYRWMTKVEINERTSDEAGVVAEEIKKCMDLMTSNDYDWSIGYYIDPKTDKDKKVIGKDIYVMLAKKAKK
jgi:hypothetical protein